MVLARIALRAFWMRLFWSISNLLYQEWGYSEEKLAKDLCVVVVGNMVGHFVEILVKNGHGCVSVVNQRAERHLVRSLNQDPFATVATLRTPSKSRYRLHYNTVRQYLTNNEFYAFLPRRKPYLTQKHKQNRLKFARRMQHWKLSDVACIWFSDESFETGLRTDSSHVRRKRSHAYESRYLKPTSKSGRSSVGVWGAISLDFKSDLATTLYGKTMNLKRYIKLILNEKAHPFYEKIIEYRGDAIWQEEGARYHTLKMTQNRQDSLGMILLEWPA